MLIANNILDLIGKTPIVKLKAQNACADIFLKLEYFNPGGSVKDRIAISMIEGAEKSGLLKPGGTIIEPTSGNTGIGLAMIGAVKGYKVIIVMPETMSLERKKLLQAYGAELISTPGTKGMKGAIEKATEILNNNPNYFMPSQFENLDNVRAHKYNTATEIIEQMENIKIDAFVAGVGTGGSITGIGTTLKKEYQSISIFAVEPEDSAVLSGNTPSSHKIQGIGAGFIPEILNTNIYDKIIKVKNQDAIEMARKLTKEQGILAGISTGANVWAASQIARQLGENKVVLTLAPSSGERYLSSIY